MEDMLNRILKKNGAGTLQDEAKKLEKQVPETIKEIDEMEYNDGNGDLNDLSKLKGPVGQIK